METERISKQVIVFRKDLNVRKGKLAAQVAHASLKVFLDRGAFNEKGNFEFEIDEPGRRWIDGLFTKICVGVESEAELHEIYQRAKVAGLACSLILDAGKTEFKEPTYTCCAVGPGYAEEVDAITGHLKLL